MDEALQLLRLSGIEPPQGEPGSAAWMQSLIDALCEMSSRDALTGLANRRQFELALARELDRVARSGEPALLMMLDIDHFKRVNDTHGHAAGDEVIRAVATALAESVRPMDLVARIGGEEFAVILPNCGPAFGHAVAERIRQRVQRRGIPIAMQMERPLGVLPPPTERLESNGEAPWTQEISVTVSVGGAFAPQWVRSTARIWTERADLQLYRAKSEGRNRACIEPTPISEVSAEEKGLLFGTSQFQDLE
jgi:diguanylate cyclase